MRLKKQQQQQETGTGRKYKFVSQLNDQGFIEGAQLFLAHICRPLTSAVQLLMNSAPQHPSHSRRCIELTSSDDY